MNITVLGGGNIGMSLVGEISRIKGYDVTLYTSKPEKFDSRIDVVDDERNMTFKSGVFKSTANLREAVVDADVLLCTLPAFMRKKLIEDITEDIKPTAVLGFVPGYGGAEMYCRNLLDKGVTIFGLQKVPYVSRTKEVGKVAGIMARKTKLYVSAIPCSKTDEIAELLEDMLLIKTQSLKNYMSATLLPGNPLLHTSGSYVYLKDYKKGYHYPEQIYYYQSWVDECSKVICDFSDEMMSICKALPIDLSEVQSIQEYYESPTPQKLTVKFHTIPSFQPLTLPMIHDEEGFMPDFNSRFYTEDIPFGVCILKGLALIVNVETPTIDAILDWYYRMTGKQYFLADGSFGKDINETAVHQLFGIDSPEKIKEFYNR
ncbi:MAG: NAD/NADP octopine/nopaline dehydrogenase family protein [Ruminococcus sp.]|nr:NAD/NADP octopine/nopaline dehydrogenase family protein [Ruminococcus sp.]